MMIAVISDTHLETPNDELGWIYREHLEQADVLIHCGDIVGQDTWAFLNIHPGFYAVRGNCDFQLTDLPFTLSLELEGKRVGIAHGFGRGVNVGESLAQAFGPEYDLILFGHTHRRFWGQATTGAYLLNPGSLFCPRDGQFSLAKIWWQDNVPQVKFVTIVW